MAFAIFAGVAMLISPSPANAGGSYALPRDYKMDFRGEWGEWVPIAPLVNGASLTAKMEAFIPDCLNPGNPSGEGDSGAFGNEFNFSFGLFGDNCYSGNAIDGRPVAVFYWQAFDSEGLPETFSCLDVTGSVTSGDIPGARIVFEPGVNFGAAGANFTRDRLTDVTELEFALELPYLEPELMDFQGQIGSDDFLIDISITPCTHDFDGPDIEHYRRMAEQATALPDTL